MGGAHRGDALCIRCLFFLVATALPLPQYLVCSRRGGVPGARVFPPRRRLSRRPLGRSVPSESSPRPARATTSNEWCEHVLEKGKGYAREVECSGVSLVQLSAATEPTRSWSLARPRNTRPH